MTGPHALVCLWPQTPVEHVVSAVTGAAGSTAVFTGAVDGVVARWDEVAGPGAHPGSPLLQESAEAGSVAISPGGEPSAEEYGQAEQQQHALLLRPTLVMQRHTRPVCALVAGLKGRSGGLHLLSIDEGGLCCLWDEGSGVCLAAAQLAALHQGSRPSALLMPDGDTVCVLLPAAVEGAASTEGEAPMMLVLQWRTLQLVAAPLVTRVGCCCATAGLAPGAVDTVVAAACHRPGGSTRSSGDSTSRFDGGDAADTVVLAVTASGWLFAGSVAGRPYPPAWQGAAAHSASTAPLLPGALHVSPGGTFELLIVQPSGWQLLQGAPGPNSAGGAALPSAWVPVCGRLAPRLPRPLLEASVSAGPADGVGLRGPEVSFAPDAWRARQQEQQRQEEQQQPLDQQPSFAFAAVAQAPEGPWPEPPQQQYGAPQGKAPQSRRAVTFGSVPQAHGGLASSPSSSTGSIPTASSRVNESHSSWVPHGATRQAAGTQEEDAAAAAEASFTEAIAGGSRSPRSDRAAPAALLGGLVLSGLGTQQHSSATGGGGSSNGDWGVVVWDKAGVCTLYGPNSDSSDSSGCGDGGPGGDGDGGAPVPRPATKQRWHLSGPMDWQLSLQAARLRCGGFVLATTQVPQDTAAASTPTTAGAACLLHSSGRGSGGCGPSTSHRPLGAAWPGDASLLVLRGSSSSSSSSSSLTRGSWSAAWGGRGAEDAASAAAGHAAGADAGGPLAHAGCKRRLEDDLVEAAAAVLERSQHVPLYSSGGAGGGAKQPRLDGSGYGSSIAAMDDSCEGTQWLPPQSGEPWPHPQHKQSPHSAPVTRTLFVSSDEPGAPLIAACHADGRVALRTLAEYAVPRSCSLAAGCGGDIGCGTPDTGAEGGQPGHTGTVSCTLEVRFKCPPLDLVVPCAHARRRGRTTQSTGWLVGAAASSSVASMDGGDRSSLAAAPAGDAPSRPGSAAGSDATQRTGATAATGAAVEPPVLWPGFETAAGRPVEGGIVPLLLTGGTDGGLVAWDLRLRSRGEKWMSVHPHTAPVRAVVLPPVHARLPWSSCVVSLSDDGSLALSCLALGQCLRIFPGLGPTAGPPQQVAWCVSRGLIGASVQDSAGQLHAQAWDVYSGQPDRRCSGAQAHMLMAQLSHEASSSLRAQQHQEQEAAAAAAQRRSLDQPRAQGAEGAAGAAPSRATDAAAADGGAAAAFAPRLHLVDHSRGALRPLEGRDLRTLLMDIDVARLLSAVAAVRAVPPPAPHHHHHHAMAASQSLSRRASAQGHGLSGQEFGGTSGGLGRTASDAAEGLSTSHTAEAAHLPGSQQQHHRYPHHHGTAAAAAARTTWQQQAAVVREAALALALLNRWGLDSEADCRLVALLSELGLCSPSGHRDGGAAGGVAPGVAGDAWWAAACDDDGAGGASPQNWVALSRSASSAAAFCAPGSPPRRLGMAAGDVEAHLAAVAAGLGSGADAGSSGPAPVLCQEAVVCEGSAVVAGLPYLVGKPDQPATASVAYVGGGAGNPNAGGPSADRLGALLLSSPTVLAVRFLSLVALSKALLSNPAIYSGPAAANAASAVATLYALSWHDAPAAAAAPLPDLLLLGSFYAAPPEGPPAQQAPHAALRNAAQALLSSLLQPAVSSGGSVTSAAQWPPAAAMQLVQLVAAQRGTRSAANGAALASPKQEQEQQPALPPQALRRWRAHIAVAALAAVSHPARSPPPLLSATATCLVESLLRLAPSYDSAMAGELLELALLGGRWDLWRPHLGSAPQLLQRLCRIADAVQSRLSLLQSGAIPPPPPDAAKRASIDSPAQGAAALGGWAAADPAAALGSGMRGPHVAGGLYLSTSIMGAGGGLNSPAAGGTPGARSTGPGKQLRVSVTSPGAASPPPQRRGGGGGGGGTGGAASPGTPLTPATPFRRTSLGLQYDYPGEAPASPAWGLQPAFLPESALTRRPDGAAAAVGGATGGIAAAPAGAAGAPAHASLFPSLLVAAGRGQLAAWVRVSAEVVAGLALVETEAVLNELSHGLAGGTPDASCAHALLLSGLARALRCSQGCAALLPHLGFAAALAVQAVDPARPALRAGTLPVVSSFIRDMTVRFPQVDYHATTLQLAVGSAKPLGPLAAAPPSSSGGGAGPPQAGVPGGTGGSSAGGAAAAAATAAAAHVHARAVAVFDVNGGARRTVLLLPASPAMLGSSSSGPTPPPPPAAAADPRALEARGTMKRAEAAMMTNWFGLQPSGSVGDLQSAGSASSSAPPAAAAAAASASAGLRAPYYPSPAAAEVPLLSAAELRGGVAAVAISPGGDALAALLASAGCVVVWRLQASWTQRLSHFGSRAPYCHLPACYLPVPALLSLRDGVEEPAGADAAGGLAGLGVAGWGLRWRGEGALEVLRGQAVLTELPVVLA